MPCKGTLVPDKEALELLYLRDVKYPRALLDWQQDVAQTEEDIEECLSTLESVRALSVARGAQLDDVEAGHSTLTVVGWTVLGLALGFGAGYLVHHLQGD